MKKLMSFLMLACTLLMAAGGNETTVFKASLKEDIATLRKAGWNIPSGAIATGEALQIKAANGQRSQALFHFPVKEGVVYGGSLWVKPVDMELRNNSDRGATLFFGFLDKDRKWIAGGEFPRGPFGKDGAWQKITIGMTRAIPENVKFIEVWVALEGQGIAQYRDLEIHTVELNADWGVKADTNPPVFTFNYPEAIGKGDRVKSKLRIAVSQNPAFPEDATFAELVNTKEAFTFPHALKPGKWYAKANWVGRCIYPSMNAEFTAAPLPASPALKVTPVFDNGKFAEHPSLAFDFYPQLPETLAVSIDGKALVEKGRNGNIVSFTTKDALSKGTYDIILKANGKDYKFLLVNKNPAHTYSFRDDHMLILDGKPYFPIGTYRDPSDDRRVFDGIKEADFNMTHSYDFENDNVTAEDMSAYLADCSKNNLTAFMGVPRTYLKSCNTYALQKHCAAMYDQKGLASFYLADEPELWIDQYSMKIGADAVRSTCPGVPRIILLCTPNDKSPTVKFLANGLSEIFWYDPYPIPSSPITLVKDGMESMRRATGGKQALWCVIQAFDWRQYDVKKLKPEEVNPKAGQIRCMTHLALSADVQGIIYYWLPNARYDMRKHSPIQWAETKACAHELRDLYPFLIGRNAPQDIKLPEGVFYWCRKSEDGRYALGIINSTDKQVTVPVKTLAFDKTVTLGPWGVEVLRN